MSDCSTSWKLPKQFTAEAVQFGDGKIGIRVRGRKAIIVSRYEAECIYSDLMTILREREEDDRR